MIEGYPFIFQMNDYCKDYPLLEYTMQYRFKSLKSNHTYIVRVERYIKHTYCVKFFDKANMNSDNKFSLRTGTFEVRTVLFTVFNIMRDVLRRDENASFFFIGENDEKDSPGQATRRFRVYRRFVSTLIGDAQFVHHRFDAQSLYILSNRKYIVDHEGYRDEIAEYVIKAFG